MTTQMVMEREMNSEELAVVLHNIVDSVNAISGFAGILASESCNEEMRLTNTKLLLNQRSHLLNTVDNIALIYPNDSSVKKRFCDINKTLDELFQYYSFSADSKGVELVCKKTCAQPDSFVWTDESKLVLLLEKLLDNAFRYTDVGMIELGYRLNDDNKIVLYVQDTGIGIKEKEQKKVFDLFYRSPEVEKKRIEGTGLGLSVVSRLADVLGAEVKLDSEYGKGSCFRLEMARDNRAEGWGKQRNDKVE